MSVCPYCERPHFGRGALHDACPTRNDRAIAYYTGAADARNGRPRRVDIADQSLIGERYNAGYDHQSRQAAS